MPPLSIPSWKVRAPPPPQKKSVIAPTEGSASGLGAIRNVPSHPGVQLACASSRYFSEQSIILANAWATTSWVDNVAIVEPKLVPAGLTALLRVPSSETMWTIRRRPAIDHGRS